MESVDNMGLFINNKHVFFYNAESFCAILEVHRTSPNLLIGISIVSILICFYRLPMPSVWHADVYLAASRAWQRYSYVHGVGNFCELSLLNKIKLSSPLCKKIPPSKRLKMP